LDVDEEIDFGLLKYGVQDAVDVTGYSIVESPRVNKGCVSKLMEGVWTGHCVTYTNAVVDGLIELTLRQGANGVFHGDSEDNRGVSKIAGQIDHYGPTDLVITFSKDDGRLNYNWKVWFFGKLDVASCSISGEWGYDYEHLLGTFLLTRAPASVHRFRYSNAYPVQNWATPRWRFVLSAVLYQVRQQLWTWSYFKERIAERRRFVELSVRRIVCLPPGDVPRESFDEEAFLELDALEMYLSRGDRRFFRSIAESEVRKRPVHS
jgi:hypothetical protein